MRMPKDIRKRAEKHKSKLANIKVFLVDVDGVLTNGEIFYASEEVGFNRSFNARDGFGLKMLMEAGIKCGIITGGDSLGVHKRAKYLGLDYSFVGNEDKREAFNAVLADGYKDEEILYIGDELFDMPLLKKSGFSATVPTAGIEVQEGVDYVTDLDGGAGAVREVIDLLRFARGITPVIPDFE